MYQFALLLPRLFAGAKESNVYEGVWYIFKGCFLVLYQFAILAPHLFASAKESNIFEAAWYIFLEHFRVLYQYYGYIKSKQ